MTEYYLVEIKAITSKVPRSEFSVDELEKLAQSILAADGLLAPLVLKQTGAETYEVLQGDRQYYAAVRAQELDPRKAEMVNAFVVSKGLEAAAVEQFTALYSPVTTKPGATLPHTTLSPSSSSDQRLTNLESRLDAAIRDLKQTQQQDFSRLEHIIQAIQTQIPAKVEPLEALNTLKAHELLQKLATASIKGKTAEKLITAIEQERKKAKFKSFTDVVSRVQGLGDKRMLSIVDTWSGMY